MSEFITVARPYAKAAFDFAVEHQSVERWQDMLAFAAEVTKNEQMAELLSGALAPETLAESFIAVCGEQLDENGQNLIRVMAENGRLNALPDVLEQNLGASGEDGYDLRQLPQDWYSCVIDLWRFVYPGVYGAKYSTKAPDDVDLLKWLADDGFSDGSSPCHWWLDGYLLGSRQHVQWPTVVEWPSH